ncbi:MAG: DUF952 domain-containing protein [Minicystis sp.]
MEAPPDYIYVLIPVLEYEAAVAKGHYRPESVDTEGFIHASPADQLTRVANKHYAHKQDVRLLYVDPRRVTAEIRWEPATGGLYPHIYGALNLDAVVRIRRVQADSDGKIRIDPKELV